jgi:PAS domain S-box-containing protein
MKVPALFAIGFLRRRGYCIARWLPLAIVALLGAAGAATAYQIATRNDDLRIRGVMELRAEWRARDFERKLYLLANDIEAMAILQASEQTPDAGLFDRFAAQSHQAGDPLQRLIWAPRVTRGGPGPKPDAGTQPGGPSAEVGGGDTFPVEFEHTFVQSKHGADADLAANPDWRSVMERSRDAALPLGTPPMPLFGTTELGYRIVWPIYEDGIVPKTVAERRARLRGFVAGSFTIDGVLNAALRGTPPAIGTVYFFAGGPTLPAAPIATYSPGTGSVTQGGPIVRAATPSGSLRIARTVKVFGQEWTLLFDFDRSVLAPLRSSREWIFPVGVLLLTSLLISYLAREQGYRRMVQRTVAERTAELSAANSRLSQEIVERRRSEKLAREGEERLKRAQSLAHMGTDVRDLRTGAREWSDETYRIMGVPRESFELTQENVFGLIHPDDRHLILAARAKAVAGTTPDPMEYRIIRPDGNVRHVYREWEIVRDAAGEAALLLGTIHDITERRQAEEQLRQAQKMEAIGNLTGGIAHDFNNLLGIIIGNLDLLRDRQSRDPDADELSGEALDAALRGADLTRRLLAFARRQPLQPAPTDVNELITRIFRLLERTLGEQVQITLDLNPDTWPVVVDPAQLEASLTNLATNARDAMPGGGRLIIVTGNRSLDADYAAQHAEVQPGDYAMVEVSDTGTGMPAEVASHIFEPFYTTKEQGRGTGLGLSMVFGFMKQSGGHINVYSEVGIGTTFRLYLRRAEFAAEAGGAVVPIAPARGNGETVLAVEDNAALRRVVVRQLTELGYRVIEAEDARTAYRVLASEQVDLIFTDVVMPGGTSGHELARIVLSRWPRIKVVLTSGFPENKVNGDTDLPNLRLLSKPYRRDDLGRLIREVLDA